MLHFFFSLIKFIPLKKCILAYSVHFPYLPFFDLFLWVNRYYVVLIIIIIYCWKNRVTRIPWRRHWSFNGRLCPNLEYEVIIYLCFYYSSLIASLSPMFIRFAYGLNKREKKLCIPVFTGTRSCHVNHLVFDIMSWTKS